MTEIYELMERIIDTTPKGVVPQFTFVLREGVIEQVNNMFGLDDALSFLFGCDLFLWKVKKVEFNKPALP